MSFQKQYLYLQSQEIECSMACFPETVFCESDPDCEETNKGCGWVFAQECDGRCDGL